MAAHHDEQRECFSQANIRQNQHKAHTRLKDGHRERDLLLVNSAQWNIEQGESWCTGVGFHHDRVAESVAFKGKERLPIAVVVQVVGQKIHWESSVHWGEQTTGGWSAYRDHSVQVEARNENLQVRS
jgi:hypothetical protein